jgi:beta-lactam-binding protein with PASTA domain
VGKSLPEAESLLKNLKLESVVADSQFVEGMEPAAVVACDPSQGLLVKRGRRVYLTLNLMDLPMVLLPHLTDLSLRKATLDLQNKGFKVGQLMYQLDIAHNIVLYGQRNGLALATGTPLPWGTAVDLVIGMSDIGTMVEVPSLTGLTLDEARIFLAESGLSLGSVNYLGEVSDSTKALIVRQRPMPGGNNSKVKALEFIDLWLAD